MFQKIKNLVKTHKLVSIIVVVIIITVVVLVLLKLKDNSSVSFNTETVKKGNIITTVTGTGQVESSGTIDLKPKVSGDVTYVGVKAGQEVSAGTLILSLDSRESKIDLETAKLSLEELLEDPDPSTLSQKENTLSKSYNDAWDSISSTITKMDTIVYDLSDLYSGYLGSQNITSLGKKGKEKAEIAEDSVYKVEKSLHDLNNYYKTLNINDIEENVDKLLDESSNTAQLLSIAIKDSQTLLSYIINNRDDEGSTSATEVQDNLSSWLASSNGFISNFLSIKNTILANIESLEDLLEGSDSIDIKSAELSLQSKNDAYNDHFLRAPISGIIAELDVDVGDTISGSVGTLITKQKIVSISLNEVDIASVEIGQTVNLTFDAVEGVSLTGKVSEINSLGTVSSGVVTYGVKITFDTDDERIKPGMSTNVEIITASKENILVVSSSVIKTRNGISYVEIFDNLKNLIKKEVEIGLSDDTTTEIISGLNEGDEIVSKTTISSSNKSTETTNGRGASGAPMGGGMMIGGSAVRMIR